MNRLSLKAGLAALAVVAVVGAENARVGALGNVSFIDDIDGVMTNPAYMSDYQDQVQATIDGTPGAFDSSAAVGPLIGIKSLGDNMSVGMWYDRTRVLTNTTYPMLTGYITPPGFTGVNAEMAAANITPIPHLLFGMNLGGNSLGIDVYAERAYYQYKSTSVTPGGTTDIKHNVTFLNPGILAGFNLDPDMVNLKVTLGLALPGISAEWEREITGQPMESWSAKTNLHLSLKGGAELTLTPGSFDWVNGINASMMTGSKYTVKQTQTSVAVIDTVIGTSMSMQNLSVYTGVNKVWEEQNVLALAVLLAGIDRAGISPDPASAATPKTWLNTPSLTLRGGVEKGWDDLKRLDAVQARIGMGYRLAWNVTRTKWDDAGVSGDGRIETPATRTGFDLLAGLGMTKDPFQFDLQINPVQFVNPMKYVFGHAAGNDLARLTATVNFGSF